MLPEAPPGALVGGQVLHLAATVATPEPSAPLNQTRRLRILIGYILLILLWRLPFLLLVTLLIFSGAVPEPPCSTLARSFMNEN